MTRCILLSLLGVFLLLSCQKNVTNRDELGLKGEVKKVVIETLRTFESGETSSFLEEYNYSRQGVIKSKIRGDLKIEYDGQGRILMRKVGSNIQQFSYEKMTDGGSVGKSIERQGASLVLEYNPKNQLIYEICPYEEAIDTFRYVYNKDGFLVEWGALEPDLTCNYYGRELVLNEEKLVTIESSWGGSIEYSYKEFDEQGNWLERIGIEDGEAGICTIKETRTISYFGEDEKDVVIDSPSLESVKNEVVVSKKDIKAEINNFIRNKTFASEKHYLTFVPENDRGGYAYVIYSEIIFRKFVYDITDEGISLHDGIAFAFTHSGDSTPDINLSYLSDKKALCQYHRGEEILFKQVNVSLPKKFYNKYLRNN